MPSYFVFLIFMQKSGKIYNSVNFKIIRMIEHMKVIFLDFDGVINDYITINEINEYNVEMLKRIVNETDAKVVVTSSHKQLYQMNNNKEGFLNNNYYVQTLKENGIDIIDCTPYIKEQGIKDNQREQEILEYLKNHPEITQFLILDDDYIIETLKEHEIFLDLGSGLREKYLAPAIKILNGELNFYHDCADEELSDTSDRLLRMNLIFRKILNGESNFYDDCTDEKYRKIIDEKINKMRGRIFHKSEKNVKDKDDDDGER